MLPTFSVGDTAEFCASSVILGIPHNPGYPLFCLLGKFFTIIFPFGDYSYRINFMSVFFAALCIYFLYRLGVEICGRKSKIACLLIPLLYSFSFTYLKNSIQSEVFSLNCLFSILLVYFIYKGGKRNLILSAFLFGLSLGNHHTIIMVLPGLFFLLLQKANLRYIFKSLLILFLFFLIGLTIYLYLPIRSIKNPGFDVGNPENMKNLYRVFTRADYGTFKLTLPLGEEPPGPEKQILRFLNGLIKDFGISILPISILLLVSLKKFRDLLPFLIMFILSGPVMILLANLPTDALSEGILERFFMLPELILCCGSYIGVGYLKKKSLLIFNILLLFFTIVMFFYKLPYKCARHIYLNYDYGMNMLRTLKPGSVFFMDGGDDTFYSMGYLKFAKRKGKNISLHDRGGVVFKCAYGEDFRKLTKEEKEERRKKIELNYIKTQPVFYSTFNDKLLPGVKLYPTGVLYHTEPGIDFFEIYSLRNLFGEKPKDYRLNALSPLYYYFVAEKTTRNEEKIKIYNYLLLKYPEVTWLRSNLTFKLHEMAYREFNLANFLSAKRMYEMILLLAPKDENALINLGAVEERLGDLEQAIKNYMKAMELNPSNPQIYYNLGVVYWRKNDWKKVIDMFNKVLEYQPDNKAVFNYISLAKERLK